MAQRLSWLRAPAPSACSRACSRAPHARAGFLSGTAAGRRWYAGTSDLEVYEPDQVTTSGGAAQITMEAAPGWGPSQRDTGAVWNVTKDHRSGFFHRRASQGGRAAERGRVRNAAAGVSAVMGLHCGRGPPTHAPPPVASPCRSWNKFCFTGGYVEAGLWLPGDDYISGFWPAFWLMGASSLPAGFALLPLPVPSEAAAARHGAPQPRLTRLPPPGLPPLLSAQATWAAPAT